MRQWFFEEMKDFEAEPGFETQFNVECEGRHYVHLWITNAGGLDLSDPVGLLNSLFLGTTEVAAPGPAVCGADPAAGESLGCETYDTCDS
jgi:hypothetical protein